MTINDIATLAGVSKSTVSRVLNNASNVNEKTRQLVLKVMKENNYVPSCMARALNKNKNNVIGLILPDVDSAFLEQLSMGSMTFLRKRTIRSFYAVLITILRMSSMHCTPFSSKEYPGFF